jgi:flavin-dependent dehydrogenase
MSDFKRWLKEKIGADWKNRIIEYQGGLAPVYRPGIKTSRGNVSLVGDAACQIKNTTVGGIVPGLVAAKALCNSIVYNKNYEKEWKKRLGKELWIHYKLRRILDRFSDRDYNYLIRLCKNERVKEVIESESREFPSKMILKLILNKPRFLRFTRFLLKS